MKDKTYPREVPVKVGNALTEDTYPREVRVTVKVVMVASVTITVVGASSDLDAKARARVMAEKLQEGCLEKPWNEESFLVVASYLADKEG